MSGNLLRPEIVRRHFCLESLEARTLLTTIDVMVVYDNTALSYFNGVPADIQKAIRQSIDVANLAHQNTADGVVLRLVRTGPVSYSSSGDQHTDLTALRSNATVLSDRNAYGADLVSMIVAPDGGGLGDLLVTTTGDPNLAFNVVSASAIGPAHTTLAHELGHNMGAGHERGNVSDPTPSTVYPYSYGYHVNGAHGTNFGDIMSYQGAQIPVFSNPAYTHDGVAMGVSGTGATSADLHSTFLLTAPVVANYRGAVVPDAAPTASIWQTDQSGDQLTFTVRYIDDISINSSTIDNKDVYVITPEGFHLSAEFLSLDVAGDAYSKLAKYRVTLPKNLPALTSLSFYLNAGQVKDSAGNSVVTGAIANNIDGDQDSVFIARAPNNPTNATSLVTSRDTGALPLNSTRTLTNALRQEFDGAATYKYFDAFDLYKFTVAQTTILSLDITNLDSNEFVILYKDANLNEVVNTGEDVAYSDDLGHLKYSAAAGTYYAYVQAGDNSTVTYSLKINALSPTSDVTAPTATLDAIDTTVPVSSIPFSVLYTDETEIDLSTLSAAQIYYQVNFPGFGTSSGNTGSPSSTTVIDSRHVFATYDIAFGSTVPNGTVTITTGALTLLKDTAGNRVASGLTLGTFNLSGNPFQADAAKPTASLYAASSILVPNGALPATYDFTIAYKDNRGINTSTIDSSDLLVTGPNSFSQLATLVAGSVSTSPGLGFTYATYRITAPGGSWDYTDDGHYTIALQAGAVKDLNNVNSNNAATLSGNIFVHIPLPGDTNGNGVTDSVDPADFQTIFANMGKYGRGIQHGDFDYDGVVTFNDYLLFERNQGLTKVIPDTAAPDVAAPDTAAPDIGAQTVAPTAATPNAAVGGGKSTASATSTRNPGRRPAAALPKILPPPPVFRSTSATVRKLLPIPTQTPFEIATQTGPSKVFASVPIVTLLSSFARPLAIRRI